MTFSIVGRCEQTGQLGVAISSSSIAVGARCPWVRAGVGVVSTQNVTLPGLGPRVLDLLEQGAAPDAALQQALDDKSWPQYRQVTVVDAQGRTGVFSGTEALGIFTSAVGKQCVAAGNMLASKGVIEAMIPAFESSAGKPLAERLLAAMQAAMVAGGEAGPVHSAALKIAGEHVWPIADLRVDWAEHDPFGELEKLWIAYQPQMQDYQTRAINPTAAPSYGVPGDE
ncbi:DUF1028 domain-containing protein [Diaphorobacter sp. HDW4A]|uniref:DUF1028 domain-containing protein n=1 Tax=Diaphorobacter sp. HDW4A TaxID=2714924 RepID=UPI001409131F|nr:DUF1028 domain-containing protein [Diaphorobacter sp. HDW4A]QIL83305.1 DUF1028 domain-containing protein [Diaphorobacter sp. HDW4A]